MYKQPELVVSEQIIGQVFPEHTGFELSKIDLIEINSARKKILITVTVALPRKTVKLLISLIRVKEPKKRIGGWESGTVYVIGGYGNYQISFPTSDKPLVILSEKT